MLDTLELRLMDFAVDERNKLTIDRQVSGETGEEYGAVLWRNAGGEVFATRAYHNAPNFNVTVKSFDRVSMAFAHFSVPKVVRGENFTLANREETAAALQTVEGALRGVGIRCNIADARLARVDLTKNVIASEPFLNYAPVFDLLEAKRMQKRDLGTTFSYRNTQRAVEIYDKLTQMTNAKLKTSHLPKNVVRFEVRYLNARKIGDVLEMKTAKDLLAGFDSLPEVYRNEIKSTLFYYEPPSIDLLCESELEQSMQCFKARYGRNWFDRYMRAVGVSSLERSIGSPEILRRVIGRLYGGSLKSARQQAWRVSVKLREARYDFRLMQGELFEPAARDARSDFSMIQAPNLLNETRPLSSLYDELRSAVLAA